MAFVLAALVAATWVVVVALHGVLPATDAASLESFSRLLGAMSAVMAMLVGSLCVMRWRVFADRADLYVGLAVVAFGGVRIGLAEMANSSGPLVALAFVVTVGLLVRPIVRRDAGAVVALAALVVVAVGVPSVGAAVAGRADAPTGGHLAVAVAWAGLGLLYARAATTRRRPLDGWFAFMLLVLCQGRLALAFSGGTDTVWLLASPLLRFEALLVALTGLHQELRRRLVQQRADLLDSLETVRTIDAEREAERATRQERDHDLRAALFAITGTARSLERYHDTMEHDTLEALAHALSTEALRLQELVSERAHEDVVTFALTDVLRPLVVAERAIGQTVELEVESGFLVTGRPGKTAEVVRNLLDNARGHAPGSSVLIRSEQRDNWTVVLVRDRGPGIGSGADRSVLFERGERGAGAQGDGSGLGLYVARRLMREQGGDLWVESPSGGGARFVLSLPTATSTGPDAGSRRPLTQAVDEHDDLEQARQRGRSSR